LHTNLVPADSRSQAIVENLFLYRSASFAGIRRLFYSTFPAPNRYQAKTVPRADLHDATYRSTERLGSE
jgi:hypothetical protein